MADGYITQVTNKDGDKIYDVHDGRLPSALGDSQYATEGTFLKSDGHWSTPTDTKNTAGATNSTNEMFFVGATSAGANPRTYTNENTKFSNGDLILNGHRITLSDSAPSNPQAGDIWVDISKMNELPSA